MTRFNRPAPAVLGLAALIALSACASKEEPAANMRPATPAESACLRDVAKSAGTTDIALVGSESSEAGTLVTVRVGEERLHWNCIAYADGSTGEIMAAEPMTEG